MLLLPLTWILLTASLFNALLLLWLGLTIFLVAERRSFGLWLVLFGILLGSLFFLAHTVILAAELTQTTGITANHWWPLGWIPVILAPLLWYMLMVWYAGLWEPGGSHLRVHRYLLWGLYATASGMLILMTFTNPIPSYEQVILLDFSDTFRIWGIPAILLVYPPYAVACIALPLDALRRPAPSQRMMGDLARKRSRPWLVRSSLLLLTVSTLVTGFIVWALANASDPFAVNAFQLVILLDLLITLLIATVTVFLGQAVVAYEIFTGTTLPRRGFARQWRIAILLALSVAAFLSTSLIYQPTLIYSLIALAGIVIVFYAGLSWRTFSYRDEMIMRLRPFISSQDIVQQFTDTNAASHAETLFSILCTDVIAATRAQITPVGSLTTLATASLTFPAQIAPVSPVPDVSQPLLALDPKIYAGYRWALPLWAERGQIGIMLLGAKRDGGLYTQEEIEVAQTGGERLLDLLAGEQMAQRLVELQRQRTRQQRVMDMQTRRALHDNVLPTIHTTILELSAQPEAQSAVRALTDVHRQISTLIHTTPDLPERESDTHFLETLRQAIDTEFTGNFDQIQWQLPEEFPPIDALTAEILLGAVHEATRNAAVHGCGDDPQRRLTLSIRVVCDAHLRIDICDNGIGLQPMASHSGGSGGGLALHSTLVAITGGTLTVDNAPDAGVCVTLAIPWFECGSDGDHSAKLTGRNTK